MNDYRRKLGQIWPELTAFLDANKIRNFSIWNAEDLIFGYYEKDQNKELDQQSQMTKEKLISQLEDTFIWLSVPGEDMRLMYYNYGVVRENKEMIRHRVFMTKLKDGCAEEYKARHDALIQQRGDQVDRGPDSNFTIWSAGGYIFGYNEIDTSMETEETPEARKATIAWEKRQLGIMDWITGSVHASVKRLGWHN